MGCLAEARPGTNKVTDLMNSSPQQQHQLNTDHIGRGPTQKESHAQPCGSKAQIVNHEADSANIQRVEATALWDVAKEMGVTCGSAQRDFVEKLMELEERDKKEAERLRNRRST